LSINKLKSLLFSSDLEDEFEDDEFTVDEFEDDLGLEEELRSVFLNNSNAIHTPIEVTALWIALYLDQGGKIREVRNRKYTTRGVMINSDENGNLIKSKGDGSREDLTQTDWLITESSGDDIPAGYGSMSLILTIPPTITNQDMRPATDDSRPGWEFGHTEVRQFIVDKSSRYGLRAETNAKLIYSYTDIEALIKKKSIKKLIKDVQSLSQSFANSLQIDSTNSDNLEIEANHRSIEGSYSRSRGNFQAELLEAEIIDEEDFEN
jgi:hypothetical protein